MASILTSYGNLSFYTIPAAWVLALAPRLTTLSLAKKSFDPRNPRALNESLEKDQTLDAATKCKIARAESAQLNNFENLGFFGAAVLAGNFARLDNGTLNALSLGYLLVRLAYNWVYVNGDSKALANARSLIWSTGVGLCITLFIKAGNALRLA